MRWQAQATTSATNIITNAPISKNPNIALSSCPMNSPLSKSIAVLPFVNMSASEENEYFCDGITEEIINVLAGIEELKVTSRTSAFFFKGKNVSIRETGHQLNVSTILEGSVRLSGTAIRITAQLIQARDDFHFWSETWDRTLDNIFQVQDEVAISVAEKVREHFGHFEIEDKQLRKSSPISGYELYLKSKSNFYKFQKDDILLAVEQIQQAIAIDPQCPFYHASEAIYYGYLGLIRAIRGQEAFSLSKAAALKAVQLDPTDPEANYSIGMVNYFFEKDLSAAQHYLNLALKHRPNYTNALLGGSVLDVLTDNHERAILRAKKAIELDPLSPANIYYLAAALLRIGRYEEALVEVNSLLELLPHHTNAYCLKGTILTRLGRYEEAIAHYKNVPVTPEKTIGFNAGIGIVHATKGDLSLAKEYLSKAKQQEQILHLASKENPEVIINIYLGNIDLAFKEIEKDIKANKYYLNFYKENPAFQLLVDDLRYSIFDTVFKTKGSKEVNGPVNHLTPLSDSAQAPPRKPLLEDNDMEVYRSKLLSLMENEMPFLDADLSLRTLAEQMGLSSNQLSWLINESIGKNFSSFINQYRMEAFKTMAKDPRNEHITIEGLAYDCGFNSKTVFNTYFKKQTGLTPSQFRKS